MNSARSRRGEPVEARRGLLGGRVGGQLAGQGDAPGQVRVRADQARAAHSARGRATARREGVGHGLGVGEGARGPGPLGHPRRALGHVAEAVDERLAPEPVELVQAAHTPTMSSGRTGHPRQGAAPWPPAARRRWPGVEAMVGVSPTPFSP